MHRSSRILALVFSVVGSIAHAAGMFFPTGNMPADETSQLWSTATRCLEFVPMRSESFTKLSWGGSGPAVCDIGFYPAGGGSALFRASDAGAVDCDGTPNPIAISGLSYSVTQATAVRMCWCGSAATGSYTSLGVAGTGEANGLLNAAGTIRVGLDNSNPCTSGVLPAATGALTASTTFNAPLAWGE